MDTTKKSFVKAYIQGNENVLEFNPNCVGCFMRFMTAVVNAQAEGRSVYVEYHHHSGHIRRASFSSHRHESKKGVFAGLPKPSLN